MSYERFYLDLIPGIHIVTFSLLKFRKSNRSFNLNVIQGWIAVSHVWAAGFDPSDSNAKENPEWKGFSFFDFASHNTCSGWRITDWRIVT